MKKVISIFLSLLIFLSFTIILYISSIKCFLNTNKLSNYLDNFPYTEKLNFENKNNIYIRHIDEFYRLLKQEEYTDKEVQKIIKNTNFNEVIKNIILNKKKNISNNSYDISYTKEELDKALTKNIKNETLKNYIVQNNYKIIEFEEELNNTLQKNNNILKLFSRKYFISLLIINLSLILILIIITKFKSLTYLTSTVLLEGMVNIILLISTYFYLNSTYVTNAYYYIFEDYINNYINSMIVISIIMIVISGIMVFVIDHIKKKNNKIKPRIRRVNKDEEDFSFGL